MYPANKHDPLFSPIHNRRVFEDISHRIKELIFDGFLKPGDRLPSETQLAERFNVGRQAIREALRLLEMSGFITVQKGASGGPIIKDTILNRLSELLSDAIRMKRVSLEELTVARLEIERVVLNHVFNHIEPSHVHALEENLARAREKIELNMVPSEENMEFHRLLARASGNHVFVIAVESIMPVVGDFLCRLAPDVETSSSVVGYHEAILGAVVEGKRDEAFRLLEEHLLEVRKRLQIFIDQTE
jgi:GntR family transcriptional repressor for pyruvate dehydrogenase complex